MEQVAKKIVDGAAVEDLVYECLRKQGSPYVALTKVLKVAGLRNAARGGDEGVSTRCSEPGIKNAFLGMHKDPGARRSSMP